MHVLNSEEKLFETGAFHKQRQDGVTLAICTHNGAARLAQTLAHAAVQVSAGIPFELLIIDNASTDGTAEAVREMWPTELADILRIVHEARPGVANARIRALQEAAYDILSFVDDDNWISPNWVMETHRIFSENPTVAMIHCVSFANFPGPEPEDFAVYAGWVAVGSLVNDEGLITRRPVSFWTAGLSLRLAALRFLDDPDFKLVFSGRTGGMTLAGEDHELCLCLQIADWDAYFTRSISFVHDIPKRRMEVSYIHTLIENSGMARHLLDCYRAAIEPKFRTGLAALSVYLWELVQRSSVYGAKRVVGKARSDHIVPSALSFHFARGKVRGWFSTIKHRAKVNSNIAIARKYAKPRSYS